MCSVLRLKGGIELSAGGKTPKLSSENGEYRFQDVTVRLREGGDCIECYVRAENTPVSLIKLFLERSFSSQAKVLGDAWERGYGDLVWRSAAEDSRMPWYFHAAEGGRVFSYGVKVLPSAMCLWELKGGELSLTLDVSNGSEGVILNGRELLAASIVADESSLEPFAACRAFCAKMCDCGIFPQTPVYGGNNWYYAYGKSSQEEILRDAKMLAELTAGLPNRPYMVVDEGWETNNCAGPWDVLNKNFRDMAQLAADMRACGVKPGCWIRPLYYLGCEFPEDWILHRPNEGVVLDPTNASAREYILGNIARLADWGFELIKHDFTVYDIFGGYAFEFAGLMSRGKGDWCFSDRSRTTAEIVRDLYRDIKQAANGALVMGCNALSHLIVGSAELQRIGDDTSGVDWARTRRMGVNSLAFRLCQNGIFYTVDADCVGITNKIDWALNSQWLSLLAKSGTPLFVSLSPDCATEEVKGALREAFAANSLQKDLCEPVDWEETETPQIWKVNGKKVSFRWN